MTRYSRFLAPIFWLTVVAVYVLAIMPARQAPSVGPDKIEHMLAFFTLAILAALALPRLSLMWVGAGLALFGGVIELTQLIPLLHRDASFADWFADLAAITVGLLIVVPVRRMMSESR
jgi:VanZ family protein